MFLNVQKKVAGMTEKDEFRKVYSVELAQEILNNFHEKGWNLYRMDNTLQIGSDESIKQNLADRLEINLPYVLLPTVEDPKNPEQVMAALEILAQKLNREMPTIKVGFNSYPLTGVTLKEREVKIHTPEGTCVSYPVFIEAINSVINTKTIF